MTWRTTSVDRLTEKVRVGEDPDERIELLDPVFEGDSVLVGTRVEGGSEVRVPLAEVEGLQGHFFSFGQTLFLGVVSGAALTVGFLAWALPPT